MARLQAFVVPPSVSPVVISFRAPVMPDPIDRETR